MARLHHIGFGGVQHERRACLRREATCECVHVNRTVASDIVDAHVEDVGALADLVASHTNARIPVARQHRVSKRLRAVGVRPFADDQKRRVLRDGLRGVQRRNGRFVDRGPRGWREVAASLDHRGDVRWRRAAASANDPHAEVGDEAGVVLGELRGCEVVVRLTVHDARQAGVRQHRDRHAAVLGEMAQVLGHLAGAGGAVEAEDVGLQRFEGGQRGTDLVDAAFDEAAGHHLVRVAECDEADVAEGRELGAWSHRAGDEAVAAVGVEVVADSSCKTGCAEAHLVRSVLQPVFSEHGAEGPERVRLDDVCSHLEERRVEISDEVGPREGQQIDASLVGGPAVVVDGRLATVKDRADRAVVDDDALVHRLEE